MRNSGKGILVLISDLMDKDGFQSALRYLVSKDMDVYVIHLLSAAELDPEFRVICGWSIARIAISPKSRSRSRS